MSQLQRVSTDKAPKPLPQFSQAVKFGDLVYCSGNIGLDPVSWKLVDGGIKEQTVSSDSFTRERMTANENGVSQRQALTNISEILKAAGSSIDNVVKMNIFLTKMDDFALMNEAFDELVKAEIKPVSSSKDCLHTAISC